MIRVGRRPGWEEGFQLYPSVYVKDPTTQEDHVHGPTTTKTTTLGRGRMAKKEIMQHCVAPATT